MRPTHTALAAGAALTLLGCGPPPQTVLALGDSITRGNCPGAGDPYPTRLARLSRLSVVNAGVCGEHSDATASRAASLLDQSRPAYLCLLIGANDARTGADPQAVGENVRRIIQQARARQVIPLVATLLPNDEDAGPPQAEVGGISAAIRQVAGQEGARLVDLAQAFGQDRSLLQADGLHPSDSGTQLIAESFDAQL